MVDEETPRWWWWGALGKCRPWLCCVSEWKAALCKSLKPLHLNQFGEFSLLRASRQPPTGGCLRKQPRTSLWLLLRADVEGRWSHGGARFYFQFHFENIPGSPASALAEPLEWSNHLHHLLPHLRSSWLGFVGSTWSAGIWDVRRSDRLSEPETSSRIRFLLARVTHPSAEGSPPFCCTNNQ